MSEDSRGTDPIDEKEQVDAKGQVDPREQADAKEQVDPKEQMRLALERKRQASHHDSEAARSRIEKSGNSPHGPAGAKKQFTRRKAGG